MSYSPVVGRMAATTGYGRATPTYGLIIDGEAGVAGKAVLVPGVDDPRRDVTAFPCAVIATPKLATGFVRSNRKTCSGPERSVGTPAIPRSG